LYTADTGSTGLAEMLEARSVTVPVALTNAFRTDAAGRGRGQAEDHAVAGLRPGNAEGEIGLSARGDAAEVEGRRTGNFLGRVVPARAVEIGALVVVVLATCKPSAGLAMAVRCAVVARGGRKPLVVDCRSSTALAAGRVALELAMDMALPVSITFTMRVVVPGGVAENPAVMPWSVGDQVAVGVSSTVAATDQFVEEAVSIPSPASRAIWKMVVGVGLLAVPLAVSR
jgi:hypothetical protein